jgi:hypothetical protein
MRFVLKWYRHPDKRERPGVCPGQWSDALKHSFSVSGFYMLAADEPHRKGVICRQNKKVKVTNVQAVSLRDH